MAMNILTRTALNKLIDIEEQWCVSIYLSTHRTGMDIQQDPIRLKNLLKEAEQQLSARGVKLSVTHNILEPAVKLLQDSYFWQHQSNGLAIFLSGKGFYCYRLPLNFKEMLVIADYFYIKSLLSLFTGDGQFYVLALSQNHVRLLHSTRYNINEVDIRQVPGSLVEALRNDNNEAHLQMHTSCTAGSTPGRSSIFHGHGGGGENAKNDLLRYFRQINEGLVEVLKGIWSPLVLAGVEYLLPIYKEANTYPHLIDSVIKGNPDLLSAEELHKSSWDIISPLFLKAQEEATARYIQLSGQGSEMVSDTLENIIPAAFKGQVKTLFIATEMQQWGSFNRIMNIVQLHEKEESGDEDLLDLVAVISFMKGGTVYLVNPEKMPGGTFVAAVFRY
jgi:hypothetical protein